MKVHKLLIAGLALGCSVVASTGSANGETPDQIGILPEHKSPTMISESERNPFAKRQNNQEVAVYDKESEESQLRRIIAKLKVNGVSDSKNGFQRVLLGDMILEKGKKVPQLISVQSETLIVSDITPEQVELSWVDEATMRLDGRKLLIPIGLDPSVEFVLKGQVGGDERRRAVMIFKRESRKGAEGVEVSILGNPLFPAREN